MNEMKPEDVMYWLEQYPERKICREAIALLREKDAEIERLRNENDRLSQVVLYHDGQVADRFLDYQADVQMEIADAKTEAINQFAERLKAHFDAYTDNEETQAIYMRNLIDEIAKEMRGEANERCVQRGL